MIVNPSGKCQKIVDLFRSLQRFVKSHAKLIFQTAIQSLDSAEDIDYEPLLRSLNNNNRLAYNVVKILYIKDESQDIKNVLATPFVPMRVHGGSRKQSKFV